MHQKKKGVKSTEGDNGGEGVTEGENDTSQCKRKENDYRTYDLSEMR
jgi:hypothetical protein